MAIKRIVICNFKRFRKLDLSLDNGLNILVGDNESGKSTILEAIHLAVNGFYAGRYIQNNLTQYIFNQDSVNEYLESLQSNSPMLPPTLSIEIFFNGSIDPIFEGSYNSDRAHNVEGFKFEILYSEQYNDEYEKLVQSRQVTSLPIEYYIVKRTSFARKEITTRSIPFKSVFIDSSNYQLNNGSDVYVSRIVRDLLEQDEIISIRQAHRKTIDDFSKNEAIQTINDRINQSTTVVDGNISIGVDYGTQNYWENFLIAQVANIPLFYTGKGTQCIIKTELALTHKRAQEAAVILLEEPESHLSHSKLNQLISSIESKYSEKQILISTHSSFVANKLGLDKLILLGESGPTRLSELSSADFFKKLAGYDTLRLLLCKKAILVEGPSDELIVQRAYMDSHSGKLPIYDGIEVMSVGLSFLRFLELATVLKKQVSVVSDNDGNIDAIKEKYKDYIGEKQKRYVKICIDDVVDSGDLKIGNSKYNYNTLEPKLLKENTLELFNSIFETNYDTEDELLRFMKANKTDCALAIFSSQTKIKYPQYILEAIVDE